VDSRFFNDMFAFRSLWETPNVPIQTLVPTDDLYMFVLLIENPEGSWRPTLEKKLALLELADKFDCKSLRRNVRRSLDDYYESSTAMNLLTVASNMDSVPMARIAIRKMESDYQCRRHLSYTVWWDWIKDVRPRWQIDLTALIWVFQYKVKRTNGSTRYVNPDFGSETTLSKSHKSYQEIAAAFDPPKVSKTMLSSYLS
jgi:hypothetical protein